MPAKKTTRVGFGYDIHRLSPGRKLIIGGVAFPHPRGLLGHSDADVLCHAVADALLGAAALGDIGRHFPDDDPSYRGISSLALLSLVALKLKAAHCCIINIDSTVVAEEPKLAPRIEEMRDKMATALGISRTQVSIKATTNEGLGHLGRKQGIAAQAVALIEQSRLSSKGKTRES